ncbi:MAG TPA: hypothetical protein VE964_16530 [Myxococcales bacterium]|nr:hypothetical protein [Myxococcales bacterium]
MEIDVFFADELDTVLRTLRTALKPVGPLGADETKFLETYSRIAGRSGQPGSGQASQYRTIRPEEVHIQGAHRRKRLVQLASIAALLGRPVRHDSVRFVKQLARCLGVSDPVVRTLEALADGRKIKAALLASRRGMRVMIKEAWLAEGFGGVVRFVAALALGAAVNKGLLWKHKKLGLLPERTLGREYWKHMTERGFGFPGEKRGIPKTVAYHDIGHVLSGYGTDPYGEIRQGSFQGGNRRQDGFFFIQFVLLQFHHGIRLTPAAKGETGYFDPADILWAIHRGASCNVDITHQWDYWPLMTLDLAEVRKRIGLIPHPQRESEAA